MLEQNECIFKNSFLINPKKIEKEYLEDFNICEKHSEVDFREIYEQIFSSDIMEEEIGEQAYAFYGHIFLPEKNHQKFPNELEIRETENLLFNCLKKNINTYNFILVKRYFHPELNYYSYKFLARSCMKFIKKKKYEQLQKAIKLTLYSDCFCMKINIKFPKNYKEIFHRLVLEQKEERYFFTQASAISKRIRNLDPDLQKEKIEKPKEKLETKDREEFLKRIEKQKLISQKKKIS
jgi:hypothetical protein